MNSGRGQALGADRDMAGLGATARARRGGPARAGAVALTRRDGKAVVVQDGSDQVGVHMAQ